MTHSDRARQAPLKHRRQPADKAGEISHTVTATLTNTVWHAA
jgi:hypothetical protein